MRNEGKSLVMRERFSQIGNTGVGAWAQGLNGQSPMWLLSAIACSLVLTRRSFIVKGQQAVSIGISKSL